MKIDTGSPQVQVEGFEKRVAKIRKHLAEHPKDIDTRKGLLGIMAKKLRMQALAEREKKEKKQTHFNGMYNEQSKI